MESLCVNATQIRNNWDCTESSSQGKRVNICGAIAVQSGQRMVGGFYGMLLLSPKHSRSLVWGHPTKGGSECPSTDQQYRLEQWSIITLFSAKDQSTLHQFGAKVLPGISLGYALHAGWIWKGDIMVADIEELEEMDAFELHARRLNAKEVLTPQRSGNFIFPVVDGTVKIFGWEQRLRTSTSTRERPQRGEEPEVLRGESDGLSSPDPTSRWLRHGWCGS